MPGKGCRGGQDLPSQDFEKNWVCAANPTWPPTYTEFAQQTHIRIDL
jgi:hypothetical protein